MSPLTTQEASSRRTGATPKRLGSASSAPWRSRQRRRSGVSLAHRSRTHPGPLATGAIPGASSRRRGARRTARVTPTTPTRVRAIGDGTDAPRRHTPPCKAPSDMAEVQSSSAGPKRDGRMDCSALPSVMSMDNATVDSPWHLPVSSPTAMTRPCRRARARRRARPRRRADGRRGTAPSRLRASPASKPCARRPPCSPCCRCSAHAEHAVPPAVTPKKRAGNGAWTAAKGDRGDGRCLVRAEGGRFVW